MQSGISVSPDLHTSFKTFLTTPTQRALLATISSETIKPLETLTASPSFPSDLQSLAPHLKPNEALYIILRKPDSTLAIVTYVPDSAPVRQKTLFASTRLTLTRELGTEHFSDTVFCTTAAELSPEGWKAHEAHLEADAPLTEEERGQRGLRDAEASEVGGTGRRGAGYGSVGKSMDCGEGVVEALQGLGEGGLVQLGIDSSEKIVLVSGENGGVGPRELAGKISTSEPRYSFYGYSTTSAEKGWAAVFIYTCPTSTKIRDRMIYASSRRSAEQLGIDAAGLELVKKIEATDPSEVTTATLEAEFKPQAETKTAFAKPKRPGRR